MSDLRQKIPTTAKVVGLRQVRRALPDGSIKCVVLAADADMHVRSEVKMLCDAYGVRLEVFASKQELGRLCQIEVGCAVVGLTA